MSEYKRQVGNGRQCGKKGCKRQPHWRVILGHFRVQVYVCSDDVLWGIELDHLTQESGNSLGWEFGYGSTPTFRTLHTPQIVSLASKEFDYTRNVSDELSVMFPTDDGKWS